MNRKRRAGTLILIAVLSLPAILGGVADRTDAFARGALYPTEWTEQAKLTPSRGAAHAYFGYSLSIDGDFAIVGAVGENDHAGAAYVFMWNGAQWTEQARLTASDREAGDNFGYSVSISGDTAIIGAMGDADNGPNAGAAYIFVRNGSEWAEQAKLTAADGAQGDHFGWRVAISENTVLVGAVEADDLSGNSGAVYVFVRDEGTWIQTQKLTPDNDAASDDFGGSISLRADYAIIGAKAQPDEFGNFSGSAYVFAYDGDVWVEQAILTAPNGTTSDRFGYSVAMGDGYAMVGAIGDDKNGGFSGAAYAFVRNGDTWTQEARLTASDGALLHRFGFSLSVSGNTAVIGAIGSDGHRPSSGAAYVFVRNAGVWVEDLKITASDGDEEDQFGYSVSLSGGTALIGAARDNDNGDHSGSAYVFQGPTPPPTETPRPTATPTCTPTATPAMLTATPTMPPRLNYLPLIARQWRTSAGLSPPQRRKPLRRLVPKSD